LVVVTTNEERELPAAFLRRCLVLQMSLGRGEPEQRQFLRHRARDHFLSETISDEVLEEAITQLLEDRADAPRLGPAKPGATELLDLLKVLAEVALGAETEQAQRKVLATVRPFAFRKNVEELQP